MRARGYLPRLPTFHDFGVGINNMDVVEMYDTKIVLSVHLLLNFGHTNLFKTQLTFQACRHSELELQFESHSAS